MSTRKSRPPKRSHSNILARAVMRDPIDTKRLAGALIELALAQAEAEAAAQAQHEQANPSDRKSA